MRKRKWRGGECLKRVNERDRRMTVVDWIILLLVAALLFSVSAFWYWRSARESEKGEVVYTISARGVSGEWMRDGAFVSVGDSVYSENGTAHLGRVTEVDAVPHVMAGALEGRVIFFEREGVFDLHISVRAQATFSEENGVRVSGVRIAAGESGTYRVGDLCLSHAEIAFVALS